MRRGVERSATGRVCASGVHRVSPQELTHPHAHSSTHTQKAWAQSCCARAHIHKYISAFRPKYSASNKVFGLLAFTAGNGGGMRRKWGSCIFDSCTHRARNVFITHYLRLLPDVCCVGPPHTQNLKWDLAVHVCLGYFGPTMPRRQTP